MKLNILTVGVGGQGTLLASRVLGKYAEMKNLDCKLSEVHGMAQRGGSVVTHIKIDKLVYSPLVEEGSADIVLSFEALEALRWAHYVKREGCIITNSQEIAPMPVISGAAGYPEAISEKLKQFTPNVIVFDALSIAEKCGSVKAVNTVMLSRLAKNLKLDRDTFVKAVAESVPQKAVDLNLKAFEAGYNL